ncbi:SpoIIIAC/SpoIIIAD family protein [Marasmitruncus massiliensis]|uniref:SpoIIIAC/SpoIIIAD family protein n=1 Tax=Marasmitruncus massiliensis TaxID=1944642 RepID=UPI000C7B2556|nr:SpoIIIAC/SpoIIIAD family protein [Marasmitruncus massiliensis]
MNMVTIVGIAVLAAAFSVVLKQKNPEYALALSLAAGVLMLGMIIAEARPLFDRMHSLLDASGTKAAYVQILFKSLGLCFITQIACDACRDLGETAIATKVEAAGKIAVLLVSLPLFEEILRIAGQLIG